MKISFDEEYIKAHFGKLWPRHVESFTRFLIECRAHFDGDLDLLIVLAVIGDRSFSADRVPADLTYDDILNEARPPVEPKSINLNSIASFSGIPRETVRRKVTQLMNKGWVERTQEGSLVATRKSAMDLAELTEETFRYLTRMQGLFASLDINQQKRPNQS